MQGSLVYNLNNSFDCYLTANDLDHKVSSNYVILHSTTLKIILIVLSEKRSTLAQKCDLKKLLSIMTKIYYTLQGDFSGIIYLLPVFTTSLMLIMNYQPF